MVLDGSEILKSWFWMRFNEEIDSPEIDSRLQNDIKVWIEVVWGIFKVTDKLKKEPIPFSMIVMSSGLIDESIIGEDEGEKVGEKDGEVVGLCEMKPS